MKDHNHNHHHTKDHNYDHHIENDYKINYKWNYYFYISDDQDEPDGRNEKAPVRGS